MLSATRTTSMTTRRPRHLWPQSLLNAVVFGFSLFLGSCDGHSARNTDPDTHKQHPGHEGHDHNGHGKHGQSGHHDAHSDIVDNHNAHDHDTTLRIGHLEQQELNIDIATAGPGDLTFNINLPGEFVLNPNNVAHVVPRVSGVTRSVHKSVGDIVEKGVLLAVLDSRELAQTKAHFLATLSKERIAQANFKREDKLWKDRISSERAYLDAQQSLEEIKISRTLAERELHALGISEAEMASLPTETEVQHTRYQLASPISGTIIERHLVRGEVVKEDTDDPIFVIADLTSIWLNLTVHTTYLDKIHPGQRVWVALPNHSKPLAATIDYITPLVDKLTRTATARVVLSNPNGTLRPGIFVAAQLVSDPIAAPILVPKTAIHTIDGVPTVFCQNDQGFVPVTVRLGISNDTHIEILSGLKAGDLYVARGGFVLKSEAMKAELKHAGHAH